jgi:hypothetical protein
MSDDEPTVDGYITGYVDGNSKRDRTLVYVVRERRALLEKRYPVLLHAVGDQPVVAERVDDAALA